MLFFWLVRLKKSEKFKYILNLAKAPASSEWTKLLCFLAMQQITHYWLDTDLLNDEVQCLV